MSDFAQLLREASMGDPDLLALCWRASERIAELEAEAARLNADRQNQLVLIARAQAAEAKLQSVRETHRQYYAGYITSGRDLCAAQEALLK